MMNGQARKTYYHASVEMYCTEKRLSIARGAEEN